MSFLSPELAQELFDPNLLRTWISPIQPIRDVDYSPNSIYLAPTENTNLDVPLSPNARYYNLFTETNSKLSDYKRQEMEYFRLHDFNKTKAQPKDKVWFLTKLTKLVSARSRKFQKSTFFEFEIERDERIFKVTTADFPQMNPEDIYFMARQLKKQTEKATKYKPAYAAVRKFLEAHALDFIKADGELSPILLNTQAPPPEVEDERVQSLKTGSTNNPEVGVIYWSSPEKKEKHFIKFSQFHRCDNDFLEGIRLANEKSKYADEHLKARIDFKIKWLLMVRKWLRSVWRFLHTI